MTMRPPLITGFLVTLLGLHSSQIHHHQIFTRLQHCFQPLILTDRCLGKLFVLMLLGHFLVIFFQFPLLLGRQRTLLNYHIQVRHHIIGILPSAQCGQGHDCRWWSLTCVALIAQSTA